jgi:hypothetical protein
VIWCDDVYVFYVMLFQVYVTKDIYILL